MTLPVQDHTVFNMVCIPRKDGDKSNKSLVYIILPTKAVFTKQPLPEFRNKSVSSSTYKLNRVGDRIPPWRTPQVTLNTVLNYD